MKCERLKILIRDWYQEVRNFTLSPVKMMELIEKHIKNCETCQNDEDLPLELDQLREIIRVPYTSTPSQDFNFGFEEQEYIYEEEILEDGEEI
ncbi:hypothetical protein [Thermodesulfobacterium hydrogeniphilum]|uniref:hypothetical protein n=1 Tax=Thermodesulfobacterium hydrogeniphilum TaxID=161156 RepID=UPI000570BD4F|nr:hypothetical protein [Thermodesulfobacterium hydrogeniphilum]